MRIDVITLFPGMFQNFLSESIIKRAREKGLVQINIHNLRDFSLDKHRKVDDRPYGGGPGMLLKPEPVLRAVEYLENSGAQDSYKIILTPTGQIFTQEKARALLTKKGLLLLCGHYEGFDQRIYQLRPWDEISIGKYILTGGELPAMVIIDAVTRLIPGVLGNPLTTEEESYTQAGVVEYPQYTRPRNFQGLQVPAVLVSGNHQAIRDWRMKRRGKR